MSITLEELVTKEGLTESQRAFVERHILKSGKTTLTGKKKVTAGEQQDVSLFKDLLSRREKLLALMKTVPLRTPGDIGFVQRFNAADQAREGGNLQAASDLIDALTADAQSVRRACIAAYSRLTVTLNGLKDPEGVEPEIIRQGTGLRQVAQAALDEARENRFNLAEADRAVTALEVFFGSAPKLASLHDRSPALAAEAKRVLGQLDAAVNDITTAQDVRDKAAYAKKRLTGALNHGPLSGETGRPLDEASAKIFMKAFAADPDLADAALTEASAAKYPAAVAKGLDLLVPHVAGGFATLAGSVPDKPARAYAKALLTMGGSVGEAYFDRLPGYLAAGHQAKASPMGAITGKTAAQVAQDRSLHLATSLMKPGGEIDLTSDAAQAAVGHTLYHIDSVKVPTPALNANVLATITALAEPRATELLQAVQPPTDPGGLSLVRRALGKSEGEAIDGDATRMSVLSAMLKPLNQGKVGSCFATAPVRQVRETQPLEALRVFGEIASTGQYKPPNGVRVPAVTAIPEGDDPLQRSWEYSLATSAARSEDSTERKIFVREISKPLDELGALLPGTEEAKAEAVRKLRLDVSNAFALQYDATAEMGAVAVDGSSRKGHFVAVRGGKAAASFKEFGIQMEATIFNSLGITDPTSETAVTIRDALEHEMLVLSRQSDFKPWDIPSGGTDAPTVALYGDTAAKRTTVEGDLVSTPADRSAQILTSFVKSFGTAPGGMVGMGVSGVHSFNGLPDHPSLQVLKSTAEGGMSDEALQQRVRTELVDKGKALSQTDLSPERAAWLFDQRLEAVLARETDPDLVDLLRGIARTRRPKKAMKPATLAASVDEALAPYFRPSQIGKRPAVPSVTGALRIQLMQELGMPEFVLADSNWGDATKQILFVVAPDPMTGDAVIWQKTEPPGTLAPLSTDWLEAGWFQAGAPA